MAYLKPGQPSHWQQQSEPRLSLIRVAVGAVALLLLIAASSAALAQSTGGEFEINRMTLDNGGSRSAGGQFSVSGSIGQHDASADTASGGQFQLRGGFWAKGDSTPPDELVFADGFEGP